MEVIPYLTAMRVSLSLKSPNEYDSLQIFLQGTVSQQIVTLIYGLNFSGAKLTCYAACFLLELSSSAVDLSQKLVPPPPLWSRRDTLMLIF